MDGREIKIQMQHHMLVLSGGQEAESEEATRDSFWLKQKSRSHSSPSFFGFNVRFRIEFLQEISLLANHVWILRVPLAHESRLLLILVRTHMV